MEFQPNVLKESVEHLLKLQEIDGIIFQLNSEIENLPPEMLELKKQVAEVDRVYKVAEKSFRDADRERRSFELKSLTLTEDIKRSENKQREVRNTKEEFSAGKELDQFRRRLQEAKTGLEEKTALTAQKAQARDEKLKALQEIQEKLKALETERASKLDSMKASLAEQQKRRSEYITHVDDTIFSLYERVQKLRRGSGVALVKDNICQGCYVSVPPHTRAQLSRLEALITCSSCSRILYPADLAKDSGSAANNLPKTA